MPDTSREVNPVIVRSASPADVEDIVDLVNRAYQVEAFFVEGDRTSVSEIHHLMEQGQFLVIDRGEPPGGVVASVFTSQADGRGYFGLLAVEPEAQGRGLGRTLIEACENEAERAGCHLMAIKVVNLRTDLLGRYQRLGYAIAGTEPYVRRPIVQPCHFVNMEKRIGGR